MKKFLKSVLTLGLVLAITFAFAGCKIVQADGTWVCNKMKATVSYTNATVDLMQWGGEIELTLDEDGSMQIAGYIPAVTPYSDVMYVFADNGTWKLDGTTITLNGGEQRKLEWNNNKIIYTVEQILNDPDENTEGDEAKITIVCELVPVAED